MKRIAFFISLLAALPMAAQTNAFEQFRKQQEAQFNQFKNERQEEFDTFRRRVNDEYAEFMRRAWAEFPAHEAEQPKEEKEIPPVI